MRWEPIAYEHDGQPHSAKHKHASERLFGGLALVAVGMLDPLERHRRKVLEREIVRVETQHGTVRVKVAKQNGKVVNVAPEYDDCQRLASEKSIPLKQILTAATVAYAKKIE